MADWPPPSYDDMRRVMAAAYDACRRHRVPIGLAPNIEVSLVVNPDDAAFLAPRTVDFFAYEAWRRMLRIAARPVFLHGMRTHPRKPHRKDDPGRTVLQSWRSRIAPTNPGGAALTNGEPNGRHR